LNCKSTGKNNEGSTPQWKVSDLEQGEIGPDEGLHSKRRDSAYRSGRSPSWIKVKNPGHPAMERSRSGLDDPPAGPLASRNGQRPHADHFQLPRLDGAMIGKGLYAAGRLVVPADTA
jgi:hypothetical protein